MTVIPAEAGIQFFKYLKEAWNPVFTGMTPCHEVVNIDYRISG